MSRLQLPIIALAALGMLSLVAMADSASTGGTQWGDFDCSGSVTPVDSLKTLRENAGLSVGQEPGCWLPGTAITIGGSSRLWGDVDCKNGINPVDSLWLLRFYAGLLGSSAISGNAACPDIGGPFAIDTPAPTPTALGATATPTPITSTQAPITTPTATATVAPTPTPSPTATPTVTPTSSPSPTAIPYQIDSCWIAIYTFVQKFPDVLHGSTITCDAPDGSPDYTCSIVLYDALCSSPGWPGYHCYSVNAFLYYCVPDVFGFPVYECTPALANIVIDCASTGITSYLCSLGGDGSEVFCRGRNSILYKDINFTCQVHTFTYSSCDYWTPSTP